MTRVVSLFARIAKEGWNTPKGDQLTLLVRVDRTRPPRTALEATGRQLYVDDSVLAAMPRGIGEYVEIVFFKIGYVVNDRALEREYESRALLPADPYSLAAANKFDPSFADQYPNVTHWRDQAGNRCFAAFGCWSEGPYARVEHVNGVYHAKKWFAGLLKDDAVA
ncbi:MAG: hypothetical protein WAV21_00345 [Minisyncoccia bacterium]